MTRPQGPTYPRDRLNIALCRAHGITSGVSWRTPVWLTYWQTRGATQGQEKVLAKSTFRTGRSMCHPCPGSALNAGAVFEHSRSWLQRWSCVPRRRSLNIISAATCRCLLCVPGNAGRAGCLRNSRYARRRTGSASLKPTSTSVETDVSAYAWMWTRITIFELHWGGRLGPVCS